MQKGFYHDIFLSHFKKGVKLVILVIPLFVIFLDLVNNVDYV